ncbi:FecCD family ABC transporter permease [Campylobacter canadensis]|uniref:Iron ABC transporter permease n=1 Tax=Campylobacter canadensis TaxID=449520 RepID=A0ABS7WQ84_9BACT|nr:iron ABC transporter permease [Campylobacter canadensis]MBZ7986502.1 iron ABC transporter permease [Campylobacter canadensis]MBZ7994095.1 iron ABC transporter permease [Campylobacter canadensis]MBZ7995902.1 iron ABC transporter permease [Campylobacter canadensis]MBZ7997539.1 iron ABC transporter permease [Campylobacter canadensis]MBZ7999426.1 iron ABC transporter permease [Campylobacter canadensis]
MDIKKEQFTQYVKVQKRRITIILLSIVLCFAFFLLDIATGPALLNISDVLKALLSKIISVDIKSSYVSIVYSIRLPSALMALATGAALGLGGALMQTILNNHLASPYTLGLSAAAGLGASIVLAFELSGIFALIGVSAGAFIMSLISSSILFFFAMNQRFNTESLVLIGIALLFLFQSCLSLVQFLVSPETSQQILFWLFGSLQKASYTKILIVFIATIICFIWMLKNSWALSVFKMGEKNAQVLGININILRLKVLFCVCLVSSLAVCFVGVIGFIGLVAPHMARLLIGEEQRFFLPLSMLFGALFLSFASVVSKIIIPGALFPIGIVSAFVGVPFFFVMILRKKYARN